MNTSDPGHNMTALIEELEQENFNFKRHLELVELQINSMDEEIQFEEEQILTEMEQITMENEELKKLIMVESNQMFEDSNLFLDESSCHNLSTSYLDASSLNASLLMEASICEPEEITILSNELRQSEMKLQDIKSKLEDEKIHLQELRNQNILAENELKKYRHQQQFVREEFREKEEELIMIHSEMSLLPKLNHKVNVAEDSIYTELVRKLEITKAKLGEKKQKVAQYVSLLHQIETDCKYFEGEILVLDVYDIEDENRRLQSQANLLEAYKNFHKELDKNIQTLKTSVDDLPATLRSNSSDFELLLRTVNHYIDYVTGRLEKLNHELTYHRKELASVQDKESQLGANVKVLRGEIHKMRCEMDKLEKEIHNVLTGVKKPPPPVQSKSLSTTDKTKEVKAKNVRFEIPEKEENKENEARGNVEIEKKPMEKMEKQAQKIVIHKRRQNRKPVNIIKHY